MTWDCEAYGPEGSKAGVLCFLAGPGQRKCADRAACHEAITYARQHAYREIQGRAAAGDPEYKVLSDVFARPDQLLGGAYYDD